jgi:predicted alpha/beta superfamily hydrolase
VTGSGSQLKRHEAFHSTFLDGPDETRSLTVYLPPEYVAGNGPYPLLLLHDGQNLFDPARAFGGQTWHVQETADALIASDAIPPLVIVGVDHGGDARVREYTPTPGNQPGAGQLALHCRFMIEDVVPFLARTYAVRTDADGLGLGGSSLGALATIGIAVSAPGRFGRLIAMSPSVWWDRRAILRPIRRAPLSPLPRIWIDAGAKEGARTTRDAQDLADLLRRGDTDGRVHFELDPEGDHSEASWSRRLGPALTFCYGSR